MATLKLQFIYIFCDFFFFYSFIVPIHITGQSVQNKTETLSTSKSMFSCSESCLQMLVSNVCGQACSAGTESYPHHQLCIFKHGSTQTTNPITAGIKIDSSFSTRHPSDTPASTHGEKVCSWASQFPFPAGIPELLGDQLHHSSAALTPLFLGWTRTWQNFPNLSFWRYGHPK